MYVHLWKVVEQKIDNFPNLPLTLLEKSIPLFTRVYIKEDGFGNLYIFIRKKCFKLLFFKLGLQITMSQREDIVEVYPFFWSLKSITLAPFFLKPSNLNKKIDN